MPILSSIGRRSSGVRAWVAAFYAVLIAGAVTMVYPFLLMLATSVTGPADADRFELIPRYLYDDNALFVRVMSEKYLSAEQLADHYGVPPARMPAMRLSALPQVSAALGAEIGWDVTVDTPRRREAAEYEQFLREYIPEELLQLGFEREVGVPRLADRLYWQFLRERFDGELAAMNAAYGETRQSFLLARLPLERVMYRAWTPPETPRYADFRQFKADLRARRPELFQSLVGDVAWQRHLESRYESDIARLNAAWGAAVNDFSVLSLPLTRVTVGDSTAAQADWDDFVRRKWSPRHAHWGEAVVDAWRSFLRDMYARHDRGHGHEPDAALTTLRAVHGQAYTSWEAVVPPPAESFRGQASADFFRFLREATVATDLSGVRLLTLRSAYVDFLRSRYPDLGALNSAYGRAYGAWEDVRAPTASYDWWSVRRAARAWRWYLATNNYRLVWDMLVQRGNALVNTVAFIVLTIALQLTVNPLCAYALSRFKMPFGEKILIFMLATMAFPAEVTMIPGFLLLRDLGLLNTFAALLLPAAAQGFSIFILKGFFDALPREVFDAATIDGAGELRVFFQILVPLSQPVLAYIALLGFTSAYTTFLFALVICQDSRMWTLMVWVYQLQGSVHESAQIAALVVVMIPTLLVFVFCQRMIMRGVVLPQVD